MATSEPILEARALLDDVLVRLGTRWDGQTEVVSAIGLVADALDKVYAALAAHTDVTTYHQRREEAVGLLRQALAGLQESPAALALPGEPVRTAAEALGLLFASRPPPFETGYRFAPRLAPSGTPFSAAPEVAPTPASFGEPRLVPLAREPLTPVVPLPPADGPTKPPVIVTPPPPDPKLDGAVVADLAVVRARALAAVAAAAAAAPKKDDGDEPTSKKKGTKKGTKKGEGKSLAKGAKPPAEIPAVQADAEAERENFGQAVPQATLVREHARAFFEDLGMMSLVRLHDGGEHWRELASVERRLLARVDALIAAGLPTVTNLVHLLASRPVPDPDLRWAAIFFFGSLAGDDARDQVGRLVRTAELEDGKVLAAVADALFFAPHPELEGLLRPWLSSREVALQRLAVRVLGRRRRLTGAEAMTAASSSELALARDGARALITTPAPLDVRALLALTTHADEKVVEAALQAAFVHKQALGLDRARTLFGEKGPAFARVGLWLALGGGQDVGPLFLQALSRRQALPPESLPALYEAIGWYGHIGLVELLLTALGAGDADAVSALFRLTGAPLTDDEPAPTYEPGEEPFVRPFAALPPPVVAELSVDPAVWSAWWKAHRGKAQPQLRYRWGAVWTPATTLWELDDAPVAGPKERWRAHLELTVRTGAEIAFDPHDFVQRQEAPVAAWKAHVQGRARPAQDGTWQNVWGGK